MPGAKFDMLQLSVVWRTELGLKSEEMAEIVSVYEKVIIVPVIECERMDQIVSAHFR